MLLACSSLCLNEVPNQICDLVVIVTKQIVVRPISLTCTAFKIWVGNIERGAVSTCEFLLVTVKIVLQKLGIVNNKQIRHALLNMSRLTQES